MFISLIRGPENKIWLGKKSILSNGAGKFVEFGGSPVMNPGKVLANPNFFRFSGPLSLMIVYITNLLKSLQRLKDVHFRILCSG